jgi:hypothetical protein
MVGKLSVWVMRKSVGIYVQTLVEFPFFTNRFFMAFCRNLPVMVFLNSFDCACLDTASNIAYLSSLKINFKFKYTDCGPSPLSILAGTVAGTVVLRLENKQMSISPLDSGTYSQTIPFNSRWRHSLKMECWANSEPSPFLISP